MSTPFQPPAGVDPEQFKRWQENAERRDNSRTAKHEGMEWEEVLKIAKANLPEVAPALPAAMTDEGKRLAIFRKVCPEEFMQKINPLLLKNPAAYRTVFEWSGMFKGMILHGPTDMAKSRTAWSVLGRLFVEENRNFAWFPVKRLMTEFMRYESKDLADEFYRNYSGYSALFVDDIDKINWQFESEMAALFQFYDWVYRTHRPCLTTTNKPRAWWADKMGDAFARRLFEDAMTEVQF